MLKRIAITGPESTGKTRLAKELAAYFHTNRVPEFSRSYLPQLERKYTAGDILAIAKGQLENEERVAGKTKGLLFCDTDFTVTKIWAEVVFGACPRWIDEQFEEHVYDLYLLCYPDLPWEPDPLRENPHDRLRLFGLYRKALEEKGFNFAVVSGEGRERLKNAVNFVESLMA